MDVSEPLRTFDAAASGGACAAARYPAWPVEPFLRRAVFEVRGNMLKVALHMRKTQISMANTHLGHLRSGWGAPGFSAARPP